MKVLLIAAPSSVYADRQPVYPLGLDSLGSYLKKHGIKVDLIDLNASTNRKRELERTLTKKHYDHVGIGWRNYAFYGYSQFGNFAETVKAVRRYQPACQITAGGPAFSLFAKPTMEMLPELDFGVRGDGELAFRAIIDGKFKKIPGLLFRKEGGAVVEQPGMAHTPTSELALPLRDWPNLKIDNYKMLNLQVSRGCDRNCGFCSAHRFHKRGVDIFDYDRVREELARIKSLSGKPVFVADAYVNRNREHIGNLAAVFRKLKISSWSGQFKPDGLDKDLGAELTASGVLYPLIGFESGSDIMLRNIDCGFTVEDELQAARTFPAHTRPVYTYMIGMPGESAIDVAKTATQMLRMAAGGRRIIMEAFIKMPYSRFAVHPQYGDHTEEIWHPDEVRIGGKLGAAYFKALLTLKKSLPQNNRTPFY